MNRQLERKYTKKRPPPCKVATVKIEAERLYYIYRTPKCAGDPPKNIKPRGIFPSLDIHEVRLRYSSPPSKFSLTKSKLSPEFGNSSPDSSARPILHSLALKLQALPQRAKIFGRK